VHRFDAGIAHPVEPFSTLDPDRIVFARSTARLAKTDAIDTHVLAHFPQPYSAVNESAQSSCP
jgi:hypothetical protein